MRTLIFIIIIVIILAWIMTSPDAVALDIRDFFHDVYDAIFQR